MQIVIKSLHVSVISSSSGVTAKSFFSCVQAVERFVKCDLCKCEFCGKASVMIGKSMGRRRM